MGKYLNIARKVIEENILSGIATASPKVDSENPIQELDIFNPETKKNPQLEQLTEVELIAFRGWYATMRKPKHGMSHEDAELLAWEYLMESMEIMFKEKRGRYLTKE
jgi:hypothetical protein